MTARAVVGQVLGHYRVLAPIGAGGMGEVYRAHDTQMVRLKGSPRWDPLRDHPRFKALLRKMNLPE